jgi:hypothetical protein
VVIAERFDAEVRRASEVADRQGCHSSPQNITAYDHPKDETPLMTKSVIDSQPAQPLSRG